ncbi:hypothetical protein FocTR4_00003227 [Fusarium oxysporum f. sp. cubense]|uniref:Uncharacterized protein n=1 Tax=Fusarium oxysporum f. sp. cubense TaxID=61366 RepID=A0A5C6TDD5_FUSOC|nr:hypothetical protein FocTR4_00003227 [Fusarium oxysporum f. sp. cubense]
MIGGHVGHSQSVRVTAVFRYLWPPTFVNFCQVQLISFDLIPPPGLFEVVVPTWSDL